MKRFYILPAVLALFFSATVFTQTPKTVTDFYLAFPADEYATNNKGDKITGKTALAKHRKSLIEIEDVKNGYLKLSGVMWEGWAEIALFKRKDGSYLVAQAHSGCGPACGGFVKFFTYQAGKWADVTAQVFPDLTEKQIEKIFKDKKINLDENSTEHYFLLPRKGTTIEMACNMCNDNEELTLAEFKWNGSKFEIAEKP